MHIYACCDGAIDINLISLLDGADLGTFNIISQFISLNLYDYKYNGVYLLLFRVPITVRFTPAWEKEVNFNVTCSIKRKLLPLTLNVKAEGYSMNCLVVCEDPSCEKTEFSSSSRNLINFGRVCVICILH